MNDLTISNLQTILPTIDAPEKQTPEASSTSFGDYVKRSLTEVNGKMLDADQTINDLATGKNQDIHNTMISMKKAEISFELVLQIRNKLMTAFDEIRRMSI
ncbi:MAG: flagellar hook-basal body complex protein FliE [Desulfosarcina sp.]|nr:flagellar hook-basal body complex protein FliE [Desulfosarcina sp.]